MKFENRVALVTGAAGAIGRGIAEGLCRGGAKVFVTDLDQTRLDEFCAALSRSGAHCRGLAADVTRPEQVKQVVTAAREAFGGAIHILINVAGAAGDGNPVEAIPEQDWDWIFAVNCKGTFLFTREVVPLMKAHGGGSIVNFSSKSGKTGSALMSAYSSAKAAILGFTQALAYELAPHRIRVNCVCPGITEATGVWDKVSRDYMRNLKKSKDEVLKQFVSKVPLGRLARVEDVVNVTLFLASPLADYMTGQAINITGGREMH